MFQAGHGQERIFELAENLSDRLTDVPSLKNEVIIDDRLQYTIGGRVTFAKKQGFPYIIALGKKVNPGCRSDTFASQGS